jgi:hypothetical protein
MLIHSVITFNTTDVSTNANDISVKNVSNKLKRLASTHKMRIFAPIVRAYVSAVDASETILY